MSNEPDVMLPPQDLDSERSVLGSILIMPEAVDEIVAMLQPEHFYSVAHTAIFKAILRLHQKGIRGIDAVTVATELERTHDLSEAGGAHYLGEILETVPHAAHVRYYALTVIEMANRRNVIELARAAVRNAYDRGQDIGDTMGAVVAQIENLFGKTSGDARSIAEVVHSLEIRRQQVQSIQGTGLADLDTQLKTQGDEHGGFHGGQLIVVASRPAMGKTAFGVGLCEAAVDQGIGTLMLPLEMDGEELVARISRQGEDRITSLLKKPLYIEDKQFELEAICSSIRTLYRRKAIRFAVIDYLTLIEVPGFQTGAEKIEKITRKLKRLAKELNIPIVLLAQLNRDLEKRPDKRPQLSDLRGSGGIEQDADVVLFLYRHEVYHPGTEEGVAEIVVGKQRNGPTGIVRVGYLKEQTRFVSKEMIPDDYEFTFTN